MAKNKTTETDKDVLAFIENFADSDQKRNDSLALLELMELVSGYPPKMWGASIIGFGSYHYKYASGHEGDAPIIGFSPRKSAISLYVFTGLEEHEPLLNKLGKFKRGKACLYVTKIADIDLTHLQTIMETTINYWQTRYKKQ